MRRGWLVGLAALLGCGTGKAEKRVADTMKDPASVQFRDVRKGAPGVICGMVNSKNGFGAYVGFTPFMVSDSMGVLVGSPDHQINPARWTLLCQPETLKSSAARDSTLRMAHAFDSLTAELERANATLDALRRR